MTQDQSITSDSGVQVTTPKPAGRSKRSRKCHFTAEKGWRLLFCFMVPLFSAIFYSIFEFHKRLDREGIPHSNFADLSVAFFAACFWHVIKTSWEYAVWPRILPFIEEKHQGLERIQRAKRVTKWIFDVLYYSSFTIFAYVFFYPIIPSLLFGERSCDDTYKDYPHLVDLKWVKEYYLFQMGSLLQKIFDQLSKKRNDVKFWEYFLHHFLAFCLVFQSYVSNYHRIGVIILLTHDLSDIFLPLLRAQEGLKYKIPVVFPMFFLVTFAAWAYLRGFVFTTCEYWHSVKHVISIHNPVQNKYAIGNDLFDYAFGVQLTFLAIMNYYWIFAFWQIFYKNIKGKGNGSLFLQASYHNNYDPNLLKATSMTAVK